MRDIMNVEWSICIRDETPARRTRGQKSRTYCGRLLFLIQGKRGFSPICTEFFIRIFVFVVRVANGGIWEVSSFSAFKGWKLVFEMVKLSYWLYGIRNYWLRLSGKFFSDLTDKAKIIDLIHCLQVHRPVLGIHYLQIIGPNRRQSKEI